jgi:hypothetical protein
MNGIQEIVNALKSIDVDGETMHNILREVNLEGQLLKQLVMASSDFDLKNVIEERLSLDEPQSLKDFWNDVYNREFESRDTAKRVWDDIFNNDALTYKTFDDYWNNFKNK